MKKIKKMGLIMGALALTASLTACSKQDFDSWFGGNNETTDNVDIVTPDCYDKTETDQMISNLNNELDSKANQTDLDTLEGSVESLENRFQTLDEDQGECFDRIIELESDKANQTDLDTLEGSVESLENRFQTLDEDQGECFDRIIELENGQNIQMLARFSPSVKETCIDFTSNLNVELTSNEQYCINLNGKAGYGTQIQFIYLPIASSSTFQYFDVCVLNGNDFYICVSFENNIVKTISLFEHTSEGALSMLAGCINSIDIYKI